MEPNYQIANISEECIEEINELQKKLQEQTNENILLVAYRSAQDE